MIVFHKMSNYIAVEVLVLRATRSSSLSSCTKLIVLPEEQSASSYIVDPRELSPFATSGQVINGFCFFFHWTLNRVEAFFFFCFFFTGFWRRMRESKSNLISLRRLSKKTPLNHKWTWHSRSKKKKKIINSPYWSHPFI